MKDMLQMIMGHTADYLIHVRDTEPTGSLLKDMLTDVLPTILEHNEMVAKKYKPNNVSYEDYLKYINSLPLRIVEKEFV